MKNIVLFLVMIVMSTHLHAEWKRYGWTGQDWRADPEDVDCLNGDKKYEGAGAMYYNTSLCYIDRSGEIPKVAIRRSTEVFFKDLSKEDQQYYKNNSEFMEKVESAKNIGCTLNDIVVGKVSKSKIVLCEQFNAGFTIKDSPTGNKTIMASLNDKPGTFISCGYDAKGRCLSYNQNCERNKYVARIKNIDAEEYDNYVGVRSVNNPHRFPNYNWSNDLSIGEEYYDAVFNPQRPGSQAAVMLARMGEPSQSEAMAKVPAMTPAELQSLTDRAERGDAEAAFTLGLRNILGWGLPQNRSAALRLFQQAARQGVALAQLALGVQYQLGMAGTVNQERAFQLAYQYFRLATQGLEDLDQKWAQRQIDSLKKTVIQSDLARLDAAVARWKPGQTLPE